MKRRLFSDNMRFLSWKQNKPKYLKEKILNIELFPDLGK
jgi:hypothetical protein